MGREPKYEPLKMGNPEHANKYGKAMMRYNKRKERIRLLNRT